MPVQQLPPALIGILVVVAVVGLVAVARLIHAKRRREAMRRFASELGFAFEPSPGAGPVDAHGAFELFRRGRSRRARNLVHGRIADVAVSVMDLRWVTGAGRNRRTHERTVFCVHAPILALPPFRLRPERLHHRLADAFGFDDVDVPEDPAFSKAWRLLAEDGREEAVRAFFDADRRAAIGPRDRLELQGRGDRFVITRGRSAMRPRDLHPRLERALELVASLGPR